MATDAQGRTLSEDGAYYWDGTAWQLVDGDGATQSGATAGADQSGADAAAGQAGAEGPSLENYSGDGSDLTQAQREHLSQYLVRTPTEGSESVDSVGTGQLSDQSTEAEWA